MPYRVWHLYMKLKKNFTLSLRTTLVDAVAVPNELINTKL